MGGSGSGRWGNHTKKTAAEDCLFLTTKPLKEALAYGPGSEGKVNWCRRGELFARLVFTIEFVDGDLVVRLQYTRGSGEEKQPADYVIRVVSSPVHLGGVRWFFLCPLMANGMHCWRRCSKLFLPPISLQFGCRGCYSLSYTSAQESHRFDLLYAQLAAKFGGRMTAKFVKACLEG